MLCNKHTSSCCCIHSTLSRKQRWIRHKRNSTPLRTFNCTIERWNWILSISIRYKAAASRLRSFDSPTRKRGPDHLLSTFRSASAISTWKEGMMELSLRDEERCDRKQMAMVVEGPITRRHFSSSFSVCCIATNTLISFDVVRALSSCTAYTLATCIP